MLLIEEPISPHLLPTFGHRSYAIIIFFQDEFLQGPWQS